MAQTATVPSPHGFLILIHAVGLGHRAHGTPPRPVRVRLHFLCPSETAHRARRLCSATALPPSLTLSASRCANKERERKRAQQPTQMKACRAVFSLRFESKALLASPPRDQVFDLHSIAGSSRCELMLHEEDARWPFIHNSQALFSPGPKRMFHTRIQSPHTGVPTGGKTF